MHQIQNGVHAQEAIDVVVIPVDYDTATTYSSRNSKGQQFYLRIHVRRIWQHWRPKLVCRTAVTRKHAETPHIYSQGDEDGEWHARAMLGRASEASDRCLGIQYVLCLRFNLYDHGTRGTPTTLEIAPANPSHTFDLLDDRW